jgi:uncharacterized protein (DUF1778 family)
MERLGFNLRFRTAEEMRLVRRAAKREDRSMNLFILRSVIEAAQRSLSPLARDAREDQGAQDERV